MAGNTVLAGEVLARGLVGIFENTYKQLDQGGLPDLDRAMQRDVPADARDFTVAMYDTAPYPQRQELGDSVNEEGFQSKSASVTINEFSVLIPWYRRDRTDGQVGSLDGQSSLAANNFFSLDSRAMIEMATGTLDLLTAVPNAPDGVGPYSSTDGDGENRFEVSGGNIETGQGVTAANITTDWHSVLSRFDAFKNTKGQPFFAASTMGTTYTIYAPSDMRAAFIGAFNAELIQGTAAAPSNTIIASGENVRLIFTPRLNGTNDWLVFRDDVPVKPFASWLRQPISSYFAHAGNSDKARTEGKESLNLTCEKGYSVNVPFGTIKVTNA